MLVFLPGPPHHRGARGSEERLLLGVGLRFSSVVEKRSGSLYENLQKPFFLQYDSETCNSNSQRCQYQVLLSITLLSFRSVFAQAAWRTQLRAAMAMWRMS